MGRVTGWFAQRGQRIFVAVVLALVIALLVVRWERDFEQRLIGGAEVGYVSSLLESLELKSYDARAQLAASQWRSELAARRKVSNPDDPNLSPIPEIVILAIDKDSMENVARWPWKRTVYAKVVRKLKRAGAKAVLFDLDLGETENHAADQQFALACREAGNVVLSCFLERTEDLQRNRQSKSQVLHIEVSTPKMPPELFEQEAWAVGLTNVEPDEDGVVRRVRLSWEHSMGYVYPALGVYGAAVLKNVPPEKLEDGLATFDTRDRGRHPALRRPHPPQFTGYRLPILRVKDTEEEIPGKKGQRYAVTHPTIAPAFVGWAGTFASYPFYLVYRDESLAGGKLWDERDLRARFGGKVVLVGSTVLSHQDIHTTPFGQMPGVEIWANVATAMMERQLIKPAPQRWNQFSIIALALIASVLSILWHAPASYIATLLDVKTTFNLRGRTLRLLPYGAVWFLLYLGLGLVPIIAYFYFTLHLFRAPHLTWLSFAHPAAAGFLTYAAGVVHMFLTEQQERKKVATRFGKIVSPSVLQEILAHAEDAPKPRRVTATLLFTDLQGFTTLSESRDPAEVVEVLNAYFDRMVPVVFKYGGAIDKYIGDAIMAIFGAPISYPDHPRRAVLAAIEMQEELVQFREEGRQKGWPDFYMRVGINTDAFMMGHVGSHDLLNYTCIGDGVNLGARLEGKNKEFGSWIMCSQETYQHVADLVIAEHKGTVEVKGKLEGVDVYVIRGLKSVGVQDHLWGEGAHAAAPPSLHATAEKVGAAQ